MREVGLYHSWWQRPLREPCKRIFSARPIYRLRMSSYGTNCGIAPLTRRSQNGLCAFVPACVLWWMKTPLFRASSKVRNIDPLVLNGTKLLPLSWLDMEFTAYRQAYHAQKSGVWAMRIPGVDKPDCG